MQTLTTKDCKGPQTNMPKNVGSIKDLMSKNNNVDMLNSASRILQCWSYYVKIISARLLRYLTVHFSKLDLICKKKFKRLFCLGCWIQNDEQALFIRLRPFVETQTVLMSRRTLNWGCVFLSVQLTLNEISGFILKFIIKVSDELTLSTRVCLLHWKINPSRRFTICFIRLGFRRNNCHSRVSGELKIWATTIFFVCNHLTRRQCWGSIHRGYYTVARRYEFYFCLEKIKFISSSRRVMFSLLYRQKDIDKIIDFYAPKSNCDGSHFQYSNIRHCLQ